MKKSENYVLPIPVRHREQGIAIDVTDAIALRALSEIDCNQTLCDRGRLQARHIYAMGKNLEEEYGG
jgi:hypothetical protein